MSMKKAAAMILIVAMLAVLANNTTAEVRFGAARPAEAKAALPVLDGPLDGLPQEKYVGTDEKSYDGSIDPLACIVLADADTGAVLFEQNPDKRAYPASTTKILSSLLAVESDRMDELITVGSEVILPGNWSTMTPKLSEGETISLRDMVYGAMLPSGCEASAAIGVALGGSTEAFVEWMNRRAAALGMNSSHFVNANGITDADHYSTAMDLTRLCRDAIKNAELCEIASTYQYVTSPTNMCGERTLTNTNYLINPNHQYYYPYAVGIKTGTTSVAKYCLTALAEKEGRRLLLVILRAPTDAARYGYARQLFDWGFDTGITAAADEFFADCVRVNECRIAAEETTYYYSPCAEQEYSLGTAVACREFLIKYAAENEAGELWYFTEQGYFIPAAAFEAAEHAPVWGFCEDGIYPMPSGEFAYGAQIKLRGTVYADCFIESISAELVNAQGETVACTENTYSTYFDLVQMEDALFAQALADGEYTLSVTAYSGAAAYTIETQFVILPPVWGDVSGDGAFNFNDVAALSLYLLDCSEIELPYMRLADYNGDGVVNYADLTDMYIALLG